MNITTFFSLKRIFGIGAIFVFGLLLVGCGGTSKKKEQVAEPEKTAVEQKGSLAREFTIVDEQGRNSGTLTLEFSGSAVLRDENGKVIGKFKPVESSEVQPSDAQSGTEATEVQSEPDTKAKQ